MTTHIATAAAASVLGLLAAAVAPRWLSASSITKLLAVLAVLTLVLLFPYECSQLEGLLPEGTDPLPGNNNCRTLAGLSVSRAGSVTDGLMVGIAMGTTLMILAGGKMLASIRFHD